MIAISSKHRKESLEAVHLAIDTMKSTVPIWKKEVYDSQSISYEGESENENPLLSDLSTWKANKECFWNTSSNDPT